MTLEEQQELAKLESAERAGCVLTGEERGRLWELRRLHILATVQAMLPPVNPVSHDTELR